MPLRFWVNLLKNPEFLLDVAKSASLDAALSVISQVRLFVCLFVCLFVVCLFV